MKIIQLIQKPQLRGAEIFACQLSNHLIKNGQDVIVVSIFKGDAEIPFEGKQIHLNRSINKRFFDFTGWKEFYQLVNSFKPDIVQANAADTLKFAVSSKLLFNWKSAIVFRNANKMGDFINSKLKWKLNNFYLSKVDLVISVSKECEKDLRKTFNYPESKITTVEIGVEEYPLGPIPTDLIEIFTKKTVITHIGGFVPEKNHEELIKIFSNVRSDIQDIQLILLGKGRLQPKIKGIVKRLGLEDCVHFLGYRNDVLNILKHSTVFVLPSLIEGLPGVILESMYAETPVIAYNAGGIGEIVKSDTGWLIEKKDRENFERSLTKIIRNPNSIKQKVLRAKNMITSRFQNDIISRRFLNCYQSLLGDSVVTTNEQNLKVLQLVTRRQYRGAELFAADLSSELLELGHKVLFVGIYKNTSDILEVDGADNRDLVETKKNSFSLDIVRELIKLLKEEKPDIIQCNGSDTLKYAYVASFFVRHIPIVYRNISIISEWVSDKPKKILYKRIFNRVAHVTSVGDEALSDFIETYNYPAKHAEVIRRGIPVKNTDKVNLSRDLREKLGLSQDAKIAVHIGNFSPEKNHSFLIDVFSSIKESHPYIKLVCVGSGILFDEFEQAIKRETLEKSIFLLGFRKDIPEIIAASDCLVLCSKVEGVPGVILEAGTQKTPSIATNVGGVKEALIDGETGFLIDNFDKEEFRNKLIKLMEDQNLRLRFGENAYEMISKGYDPKLNARKFEQLYQKLLKTHAVPS
jgi:L-malate glycosyltransferase